MVERFGYFFVDFLFHDRTMKVNVTGGEIIFTMMAQSTLVSGTMTELMVKAQVGTRTATSQCFLFFQVYVFIQVMVVRCLDMRESGPMVKLMGKVGLL